MKTLFLVNARSGVRRKYDVAELIRETASGDAVEVRPTNSKEELDEVIDDAERSGFEVVYAVGGDGTVHEIAKRLVGRQLALGILPTGSGNGFARHIGLPVEPRASLRACAGRRIAVIDTAAVNGLPFVGVMGIGFDAWIADRFAASSVRGLKTYVQIGTKGYFAYVPETYTLTIDGQTLERRAWAIAIANTSQYGNDARIAPLASLQDGLLDVVIIRNVEFWRVPILLTRLFRGTLHRAGGVEMHQATRVTITRPTEGPAHLDGEPLTLGTTLDVEVRPKSLRVLLPDATKAF
jgi:YegS/Rv2252/BmrU family lipid kinase